jgi:hypothetical protein
MGSFSHRASLREQIKTASRRPQYVIILSCLPTSPWFASSHRASLREQIKTASRRFLSKEEDEDYEACQNNAIPNVNIAINGILATFLHFGTVEAQTASGSEEEFRSHFLPRPRELKALILQAADQRMLHTARAPEEKA